jgi:ribose transport system permease protein
MSTATRGPRPEEKMSQNVPAQPAGPVSTRRGAINVPDLLRTVFLRYGMVWVLVVLVIVAQNLYPTFLTSDNLRNLISQNAPMGIIAVGMTLVIISGGFDLSVGAVYGLGAVTFAKMSPNLPVGVDLVVVVLVGVVAGLVNGLIITRLKVNPFIATLGTSSLFLGAAFIYSNSFPVPVEAGFDGLGTGRFLGIPVSGIVMILIFLAGGVLLGRTTFGQSVRAVGGNDEAARLAGLRVNTVRCATYVITGGLAAFAGAIDTSKLNIGQADQGASLPLLAIAVVIIGGTSLMGGEGAMWRTVIGLLIIATMTNLFDSLAVTNAVQLLAQGAVLIIAVSFDMFGRAALLRGRSSA